MTSLRQMPARPCGRSRPIRGVLRALPGHVHMQRFQDPGYRPDEHWDEHFHRAAGAAWPCAEGRHVKALLWTSATTSRDASRRSAGLAL